MKKVLVTGASGFIGRHTIDKLKASGYEVHAIAFKNPLTTIDVIWHTVDLLNFAETAKLIEKLKPTHLLHLAWDVSPGYLNSLNNFEWVNASINLMKEFQKHNGKRIVMSGTCLQYKEIDSPYNEETTPRVPSFVYGTCKQALQSMLEIFSAQTGISYAWGYVFFLYGKYEYPYRLVPSVMDALIRGENIDCTSGQQIRDFLYVEDVADAFVRLLDSDFQGSINIASGQALQLKELINKIVDLSNNKNLVNIGGKPTPQNERYQILADTSRLKTVLNWTPKYSINEGLIEYFDWRNNI